LLLCACVPSFQHFTTKCCTTARHAVRGFTAWNLRRSNRFLSSPKRPGPAGGPLQPVVNGYRRFFCRE
jgi:hypothetical protein